MSFIAAGMESDQSDSDCDIMVFSHKESSNGINNTKLHKNPNLEFIAVSRETVAANGNFTPILEKLPSLPSQTMNVVKSSTKSYSVTHKDQPLDDLRYAVLRGNLDIIKSLMDQGIKVDCLLKAGWTGLMYACSSAHDNIVQYFLEKGADPNYHKDFFTPLMAVCACASNQPEPSLLKCCQYLLQYKAEVNVHERHLTTPLMFAAREGHFCIVQELLKSGADLNKQDNCGKTALMWAAVSGYGQIVRFLLIKGADANDVDSFGQTAADLARHEDYKEIAALLEKSALFVPANLETTTDEITDAEMKEKKLQAKLFPNNTTSISQNNSRFCSRKDELEIFLRGLDLSDLIDTIKEHKLTFYQFLNLNEKELENLGIDKIGVRKAILDASQGVHKEKWKRSSLPNMKQLPYISCPDAIGMIANISEHLEHIASQIVYIRLQIQAEPKILELAQDTANVHTLVEEADTGLKKVKTLYDELRFLKLYLHKVEGNTQYVPADLIEEDELRPDKTVWTAKFVFGVFIVSVTIGGILWKKPESLAHVNSFIASKIPYFK